ncbi:MAG: hypothetical protein QXX38_01750 [Candidatus Aenigmatarchaeota archaeon]
MTIKKALKIAKTREELRKKTKLPERTISYYLAKLKRSGYIKEILLFSDLRRKKFLLSEENER